MPYIFVFPFKSLNFRVYPLISCLLSLLSLIMIFLGYPLGGKENALFIQVGGISDEKIFIYRYPLGGIVFFGGKSALDREG